MTGETATVRRVAYSENGGQFQRPWRMVDDGKFKYVYLLDTDREQLFDMDADPHCLDDISAAPGAAAELQRLRMEMLRIHVENPPPKTGKAAYSPGVPHRITRERLERTRKR